MKIIGNEKLILAAEVNGNFVAVEASVDDNAADIASNAARIPITGSLTAGQPLHLRFHLLVLVPCPP